MMRLRFNRKAVSPVIASVLMIVIVMAGMTLLFGFVASYTQSFQAGTGGSVLESVTFEDVWFTGTQQVNIWLYNTGKADITLNSIYINGAKMGSIVAHDSSNNIIHFETLFKMGSHVQLTVTLPSAWQSGTSYLIKIVTQRGSGFQEAYTA
jgi:flagellin-like protein